MGYPIYHSQYTAAQIEAAIGKGPRVNASGFWEVWNVSNGAYESTGVGAGVTPPTVVTQASQMTNHGYIYIYNGSETGYTAGYWYYWDGSAWTAGGAYQVAATDPTLSIAGAAADAKATGDAVGELKSAFSCETSYLSKAISDDLYDKTLKPVSYSSANYRLLDDGRVQPDSSYKIDKYSITSGTTVTIESDHKFQFQSSDAASTLNANNRIGATYGTGTFVADVPTGATFILVSTPATGSTAKVYIDRPVSDDLSRRIGVVEDKYDRNVDPFTDSINLYNGEDFIYGGWSGSSFTLDSTENKITAIIECKPNTQYWIVRNTTQTDNFGRIGTSTTYPVAGTPVTQLVDNIGGSLSYNVTTGTDAKYLLFYYTYSASNQFIQITDYATTSLNQNTYPVLSDTLYTKRQVNEIVSQLQSAKKCKVSKTENKIDIYMPSKTSDKYIHFAYELVDNSSINFYQWKVMDIDVCDSSLNVVFNLYATSNNVEWEGVVKENGADDFIGGYHGDEINSSISVMIDGKPLDMASNLALTSCDEVLIVNKSIVNSCDDPTNQLFTRYKVSRWTSEKYTIRNRWIALKDNIALSIVYMTMFSLPIEKGNYGVATSGRYDDGYIVQDPTGTSVPGSCVYPSHYAKTVEFWGNSFYGRCTAIYDSYTNYTCICDRSQTNLFKGYWKQHNNGITMNTNDELNGFSEYEFMF